jgi:thiol-disulfide isomerase/thioredoxin
MLKHHLKFTSLLFLATALFCYFPATSDSASADVPEVVTPDEKVDPPAVKMLLEVQSASWCGPCRKMKASGVLEDLKKLGWEVKMVPNGIGRMFPSFRVTINGKSETLKPGYSNKSSLLDKINKAKESLTR